MAFWWVNHKQTRNHEVRGGYLWSPKRNANGATNQTYENMTRVKPGDIIFSYANGQIGAVGRVREMASACPKPPEFGHVGDYWSHEGWLVNVEFNVVYRPIHPKSHIDVIAPLLPASHSPLQKNGNGNQGCYLAAISEDLGRQLLKMLSARELLDVDRPLIPPPGREPNAEIVEDIHKIEIDGSIPETQRIQLARARVGQGLFRTRVILLDQACRVTGVDDKRVLIASHIKPWSLSSNEERVSGYNGILLSPHVDALFDDHLITFEENGKMHVHESLPRNVLDRWSIDPNRTVSRFLPEQAAFLEHHQRLFEERR